MFLSSSYLNRAGGFTGQRSNVKWSVHFATRLCTPGSGDCAADNQANRCDFTGPAIWPPKSHETQSL